MDVILDVTWEVVVDNGFHLLDINAARRHVGGDHDRPLARLEVGEHILTLALVLISVDDTATDAPAKLHAELIRHALRRREDDRARARLKRGKDLLKDLLLLILLARDVHVLRDVLVGVERVDVADLDLNRRTQELISELAHSARPRGGIEECLALWPDAAVDDLADLGLEAHVEHAIGLVHHEIHHLAQLELPALAEVVDAARGTDDALRTQAHLRELLPLRRSAVAAY
mmetsp:Transcript_66837/g.132487  ORF Transcript_66837/g.132487 Transcript_66837/m.132487 type:complete len:230 (+) Transcript_66837:1199-1888(+)